MKMAVARGWSCETEGYRGQGEIWCLWEHRQLLHQEGHAPRALFKTLEEQVATAKKYNMQVEDEEPWLGDGVGYGDYPKFPDRSQQERDPWCDWNHPNLMLNWGEPRLWDLGVYSRKRVDASSTPVPWNLTRKHLCSFTAFMTFMFWVWGECHSPAHVWNQICILILIGNWKRSAILPQR